MQYYHKTSENSKKASRPPDRRSKTKTKPRPNFKPRPNKELLPREELGQQFLTLFDADSANFCCITAELPKSGKPEWKTIDKYPLKPVNFWSRYQEPLELVGKRFSSETSYGLFDLDIHSKYNPDNDREAYRGLIQALKRLGINNTILVLSSFNGGYHLYFFLPQQVKTYPLAVTLRLKLEAAGFEIKNGQLEIFPNTKQYVKNGFSLYQAHRMPLQAGSFFLNKSGNWSNNLEEFIEEAEESKKEQDISKLKKACKYYYKKWQKLQWRQKINMKTEGESNLERWKSDLREQIEQGFTGSGQTNDLLKTITTHGIVFGGFTGQDLVDYTAKTVKAAPGYNIYCRHKHHIKTRAKDWGRCGEKMYIPHERKPTPTPIDIAKHRASTGSTYANTMDSDVFDKKHPIKTEYATRKEEETKNRILDVIEIIRKNGTAYPNLKTFMADVNTISKEKYGVGTGYDTLMKYKAYWSDLVSCSTTESQTNTQNSTDNNSNTDNSNKETLDKLIFPGSTNLQNTTVTQDQAIQQPKKRKNKKGQAQDVVIDLATSATKNSEKILDASKASGTSDSTTKPPMSKSILPIQSDPPPGALKDGRRSMGGGGKPKPAKPQKDAGDSQITKEPHSQQKPHRKRRTEETKEARKANYAKRMEAREARKQQDPLHVKKEYPETLLSLELREKLLELEIPLDPQLIKKLSESSEDTINGVLERFKQASHKINNRAAWMMRALAIGYQPHTSKDSNSTSTNSSTVEGTSKNTEPKPEQNPQPQPISPPTEESTSKNTEPEPEQNPQPQPKKVWSEDFLRFWVLAQKTEGFLKPGQTLDNLEEDAHGEPKISISAEIAAKFLKPLPDSFIRFIAPQNPDVLKWRDCKWRDAEPHLEDLLEF